MKHDMSVINPLAKLSAAVSILITMTVEADVTNWDNSPYNFKNSEMNWENSPMNFRNSPMNLENNPININSDRIIRDSSGEATGYAVPKADGGVNYYDLQGNRQGYQRPESRR